MQPESPDDLFQTEVDADVLVIMPLRDMEAFHFLQIEGGAHDVLELLDGDAVHHVVIDFSNAGYFSSSALSFFTRLWRRVREKDEGRMALCNVSETEREILGITKLDTLWPICNTREEALATVRKG